MKFSTKIVAVTLAAVLLEVLYFNFQPLAMSISKNIEKNLIYSMDDLSFVNWEKNSDGSYTSLEDPQVLIPTPQMKIELVEVNFRTEPSVVHSELFYTDANGTLQVCQNLSNQEDSFRCKIGETAQGTIRLDIGETSGVTLSELIVVVNPVQFDISVSRIVAVLLIYVFGSLLFRIQKMPDYHITDHKEEQK